MRISSRSPNCSRFGGVTPRLFYGDESTRGLVDLVTVKTPGRININTASPAVLRALGLADAEISEILQGRRAGPYMDARRFAGRDLAATTQTLRVQAEGLIGEEPRARLTAVVRKRAEGTGDVLVVLEWSETH